MRAVMELLAAYSSWLSRMLLVTPEFITKDRRGKPAAALRRHRRLLTIAARF
jgi:hypothetical protein